MEAAAILAACSERTGRNFTHEECIAGEFKKHLIAADFDVIRGVSIPTFSSRLNQSN